MQANDTVSLGLRRKQLVALFEESDKKVDSLIKKVGFWKQKKFKIDKKKSKTIDHYRKKAVINRWLNYYELQYLAEKKNKSGIVEELNGH